MKQKIVDLINVIFGFRKFLLMLMIYAIAVIFRINDLVNGEQMVNLLTSTTIGFFTANGTEHVVGVVKDYIASKKAGDDPKTAYEDLVSDVPKAKDQEAEDLKEEAKNG